MHTRLLSTAAALALLLSGAATGRAQHSCTREIKTPEAAAAVLSLDGSDWTLRFWKQGEEPVTAPDAIPADARSIRATVPGNVDIDLCDAGLEEDPRIGLNNYLTRRWEDFQWCYSRSFIAPAVESGKRYHLASTRLQTSGSTGLGSDAPKT